MIKLAFARRSITPSLTQPVYLAGFGRNRVAETVHDDLDVRVLAFESDGQRLFLVSVDLLGMGRHHCIEIEDRLRTQFAGVTLLLCCTHTHHGPDPIGFWGPDEVTSGVNTRYIDWVKAEILTTCLNAAQTVQETTFLRSANVPVPGVARNYRDPHILDIELTCLQFCDAGGTAQANVLIFPCHPEVLSPDNVAVTSDYPDALRRAFEAATGAPALFFSGALGGMMSPATEDRTFNGAAATGNILARAGIDALKKEDARPIAAFQHRRQEYTMPLENPVFRLAIEMGLVPELRNPEKNIVSEANLVRFDDTWLITVPGELFPALGLEIKEEARTAGARIAGVIGLANDELGYIMPKDDFVFPENPFDPGDHYEETMSVGSNAGPLVMAAVKTLLGR